MPTLIVVYFAILTAATASAAAQVTVRVEEVNLQGPRPLQEETSKAVIRDYLQSWKTSSAALEQNRADLLDPEFVGSAKDKLTETIRQQVASGISTHYQDRAHDIQIMFYSPEGLSIELSDKVTYDVELLVHGRVKTTQHVETRYVIVLTPAEVRWRVRIFQGAPS
jgi:hypothetical protein